MSETASGQRHDSQALVWPHPADTRGDTPGTQGTTQAHTPGPWDVGTSGFHVYFAPAEYTDEQIDSDRRYDSIIADTRPANAAFSGIPDREMQANARLIAAAPDLLAALVEYVERHEASMTSSPAGLPEYDRAVAAIAKAEGR